MRIYAIKEIYQKNKKSVDAQRANILESQMSDEWWLKKRYYAAEERIITDDLNDISVNRIVDYYEMIANYFNITDILLFKDKMSKGFDISVLKNFVTDQSGKEKLAQIERDNFGSLDLNSLMKTITSNRLQTSDGYMDIAKKSIDTRVHGVERKVDALEHLKNSSNIEDDKYSKLLEETEKNKIRVEKDLEKYNKEKMIQRELDSKELQQFLDQQNLTSDLTEKGISR